jgi:predicted SAM-dependent methyltransferase
LKLYYSTFAVGKDPVNMNKLNIGCGDDVKKGWVNLDIVDYGDNIKQDLDSYPWPFSDNTFDYILASHILEHLKDFNSVINELWRISKPNATIEVRVPFFLNSLYYGEPDHRIPFSIRSFDGYEDITNKKLKWYEEWKKNHRTNFKSKARFSYIDRRFKFSIYRPLKWIDWFINIEPVIFELFFAQLLPPQQVFIKLKVVK